MLFLIQSYPVDGAESGCELLVRRTNICLQVEELATLNFHWLGGWEILTLHSRFIPGHKHPIRLLIGFPMELFLKIYQM